MRKRLYARALVPNYVPSVDWDNREAPYAPWIIGHKDEEQLTNERLDALYLEWSQGVCEGEFFEFIDHLEGLGYTIFQVENPGVWRNK